jgi:hypothetical protein
LFRELAFGLLTALAVIPLWLAEYPPIQDLPQHLAAIRVLHSYSDARFGFDSFFVIDLFRTQYLTYYLSAHLLAYPFGVVTANKLLLTVAVGATPYAMRHLLSALGHDQRLALFVFPLLYNVHLILGFFNFLAAIPLALLGLALVVRQRTSPATPRAVLWSLIALLTFYTHVVPFGFFILGAVVVSVGRGIGATARRLWPVVPAAIGAAIWCVESPAGRATATAALLPGSSTGVVPQFQHWRRALADTPAWLTDILWDNTDNRLLYAWAALVVATLILGARVRGGAQEPTAERKLVRNLRHRLAVLAPLSAVAYFVMPISYDWIWPIAQRFPLLAAIFLIAVLPRPRRLKGQWVFAGVVLVSLLQFYYVGRAFHRFDSIEVGELSAAIRAIPRGQRVAGLIWRRGSREIRFSPFIHSVAYYQVRRGGAVMFTFADFPQSPFRFREGNRPPRVPPRWEWLPERVDPARDLRWYDYVLVRGGPGRIRRQRESFQLIFRSARWRVFKRRSGD